MVDVNIVGAGVMGLCVATELAQQGFKLHIYEPQSSPGPKSCSWWAGGMLAPYCEAANAEIEVLEQGRLAADWWQEHTGMVNRCGTLVVATHRDRADLRRFARRTQSHKELQSEQIAELEPDVSEQFLQGLYYPDEAHLSPRDVLAHLKNKLVEHGARFVYEPVDPIELSRDQLTIDCRGISAQEDMPSLRGVKGEMLILRCPDVQITRPVRMLHPRIPLYIVPRGEGIYMLGATMIESSAKKYVTTRSVLEMLSAAYALNPAFGEAEILEVGVDSRPAFQDNLPKIERTGNLIRANGLYRHGFLLAPSVAMQVRDELMQHRGHRA